MASHHEGIESQPTNDPDERSEEGPFVQNWTTYVLECSDGSYYVGITQNVEQRVLSHNAGRAAAWTRQRRQKTGPQTGSRDQGMATE